MKNSRGITLISLIITIIVMLILAGVALSFAVGENGVMTQAEEANAKMEQKGIEEIIKTSYYYDEGNLGRLDYTKTKEAIENNLKSAGYTVNFESGTQFPINVKVTGKTGEYNYTVTETGIKSEERENNSEPVDTTLSVGKTIYYDSDNNNKKEEWIVYSLDGDNNFEIISANTMGNLKLGYEDPYLPATVGDLDRNGTAEENVDKAIYSYNHAIETINDYCASIVIATDHSGVRSIGAKIEQDTVGMEYWNVLKGADTYGEEAITYISNLGGNDYLTSKDSTNYWIASRVKKVNGGHNLCVYQVGMSNDLYGYQAEFPNLAEIIYVGLMGIPMDSSRFGSTKSAGVRPIISNPVNYSFTNN